MKRKKRKHIFVNEKQEKDVNKVYVNIKHCVHWGKPTPSKAPSPTFLPSPPPKSKNCSSPPF